MAENFNYSFDKLPDDIGYNNIYKYQWTTTTNAIPMSAVTKIQNIVSKRWGWHFIPHENMDYSRDDWFENQTLIVSFESKLDLVLTKLMISLNK